MAGSALPFIDAKNQQLGDKVPALLGNTGCTPAVGLSLDRKQQRATGPAKKTKTTQKNTKGHVVFRVAGIFASIFLTLFVFIFFFSFLFVSLFLCFPGLVYFVPCLFFSVFDCGNGIR